MIPGEEDQSLQAVFRVMIGDQIGTQLRTIIQLGSYNIILYHIISHHIISYHITLYYIILNYIDYIYMCMYIYIYIYVCVYIYIYTAISFKDHLGFGTMEELQLHWSRVAWSELPAMVANYPSNLREMHPLLEKLVGETGCETWVKYIYIYIYICSG